MFNFLKYIANIFIIIYIYLHDIQLFEYYIGLTLINLNFIAKI